MDINDAATRKCNFCEENIPVQTRRCPYCGSLLRDKDGESGQEENLDIQPVYENDVIIKVEDSSNEEFKAETERDSNGSENSPEPQISGNPLSNGLKVFLTIICTIIPGLGQLAGIITGIVFMNSENDPDRKSFGVALMVASLIFFVISCLSCFIILIGASAVQG